MEGTKEEEGERERKREQGKKRERETMEDGRRRFRPGCAGANLSIRVREQRCGMKNSLHPPLSRPSRFQRSRVCRKTRTFQPIAGSCERRAHVTKEWQFFLSFFCLFFFFFVQRHDVIVNLSLGLEMRRTCRRLDLSQRRTKLLININ